MRMHQRINRSKGGDKPQDTGFESMGDQEKPQNNEDNPIVALEPEEVL